MIDPLHTTLAVAGSGLHAQSQRMKVISENLANVHSTGDSAGSDPYMRRTITFKGEMDRIAGGHVIKVSHFGNDTAPFPRQYDPSHVAADAKGYVKKPNVNLFIEMADLREANRSYQANLQVFKQTREMYLMTIDLLKG